MLLPELRSIYATFAPVLEWRLIGPFPRDGKAHPPQKELKLDAASAGAGQQVRWRRAKGDPGKHGKINLAALCRPNQADAEGKALRVLKKDIEERSFSPVSVMPNGLNEGLTLQDFADVVAYLEARREGTGPPKK